MFLLLDMKNLKKRVISAWLVLNGKQGYEKFITQQRFEKLMSDISESEEKITDKYKSDLYNVVDVAVPSDKIKIVREKCDKIAKNFIESVNIALINSLQNIADELPTAVPSEEPKNSSK